MKLYIAVFFTQTILAGDLYWFQKRDLAANWATSGTAYSPNDMVFRSWAISDSKKLPKFNSKLSLNCWEYILYSAYRNREINKDFIKNLYASRDYSKPFQPLMSKNTWKISYTVENKKIKLDHSRTPKRGDLIFLDDASHVVQATGKITKEGIEVISFAPLPIWGEGQLPFGKSSVKPEITTLEALIQNLHDLYPDTPSDWNQIEIITGTPLWEKIDDCKKNTIWDFLKNIF